MNIQVPDKVKALFDKLNSVGLPIPMIQDCLTHQPSLTYTLTLIAGVMVALACCHVAGVDYDRAMNFLQVVGGGYLVRQGMKHVAPLTNGDDK